MRHTHVSGIDAAISDELTRLLGDGSVKSGIRRVENSLPASMDGLGISYLAMITPGANMSSLITSTHNLQLHSPRLHEHLMNSVTGEDQFYASCTYDQVMEHHDWHDGKGSEVNQHMTSHRGSRKHKTGPNLPKNS